MLFMIIFIILLLLCLLYTFNSTTMTENFDNFNVWNNNLSSLDNLDNLESVSKPVNYDLGNIPMYNLKDFNASLWHLRFNSLVGNRYSYDDIINENDIKSHGRNNWDNGNNNNNCHANNCDTNNCHGSNCYEKNYAILKNLPTCQNNKNCPVDKLF